MAKAATKLRAANEFAGMTVTECGSACNVNGCVISGKDRCAHPFKGGLDQFDKADSAVMDRFERAKKFIGKKKLVPTET